MPFYPPFNMPFFYNNYRYPTNFSNQKKHTKKKENYNNNINYSFIKDSTNNYIEQNSPTQNVLGQNKKASENSEKSEASEAFFEIFGLKLYFDDILIICILFFLYTEKVHNDELFICLILLLLTWFLYIFIFNDSYSSKAYYKKK